MRSVGHVTAGLVTVQVKRQSKILVELCCQQLTNPLSNHRRDARPEIRADLDDGRRVAVRRDDMPVTRRPVRDVARSNVHANGVFQMRPNHFRVGVVECGIAFLKVVLWPGVVSAVAAHSKGEHAGVVFVDAERRRLVRPEERVDIPPQCRQLPRDRGQAVDKLAKPEPDIRTRELQVVDVDPEPAIFEALRRPIEEPGKRPVRGLRPEHFHGDLFVLCRSVDGRFRGPEPVGFDAIRFGNHRLKQLVFRDDGHVKQL